MVNVALLYAVVINITLNEPTNRVNADPLTNSFPLTSLSSCPDKCLTCNQTYCFACETGYKGDMCELLCYNCRPKTQCEKRSGYCMKHCRDGLGGETCNETCNSKCMSCDRLRKNYCNSCANGRYVISCNSICSKGCLHNSCNGSDGVCSLGCVYGYWGDYCQAECANCRNGNCDNRTGLCLNSCADGYNGMNCNTSGNKNNFGRYSTLTASSIGLVLGQGLVVLAFVTFVIASICAKRHSISSCLRCSNWRSDIQRST